MLQTKSAKLYFAYGSNLDSAQMCRRCPDARLVGVARLCSHRLGFAGYSPAWRGGVATVLRDSGGQVPGLVWALSGEDLERLDRFEGHPFAYVRKRLLVEFEDGARHHAFVYVKRDTESTRPGAAYLGVIWRAYHRHGFDKYGLAMALGG